MSEPRSASTQRGQCRTTGPGIRVKSRLYSSERGSHLIRAKNDHLDSKLLARLPLLHPEGLGEHTGDGPAEPLRRLVKVRSSIVKRRTAVFQRLDAQLELLGPAWYEVLGSNYGKAALALLARYADPTSLIRLGHARLTRFLIRHSRGAWCEHHATMLLAAAADPCSCGDLVPRPGSRPDGTFVWSGRKFFTRPAELEKLWADIGLGEQDTLRVVMEPTRNVWAPVASWFRQRGARISMVPTTQSAELRAYYSKHGGGRADPRAGRRAGSAHHRRQ